MKIPGSQLWWVIVLCLLTSFAFAPPGLPESVPHVGEMLQEPSKGFDTDRLEEYRGQRRFQYVEQAKSGKARTWVMRFLMWLWGNIIGVFSGDADLGFKVVFWLVVAGLLLFLIYKLIGSEYTGALMGKSKMPLAYSVDEEDLHTIDFEAAIAEAKQHQDFRVVVRLSYLYVLKLLADSGSIRFFPGKTNVEYQRELQAKEYLGAPFQQLSQLFSYAWYGNFSVSEADAEEALGFVDGFKPKEVKGA